jgi:hypothetical protein
MDANNFLDGDERIGQAGRTEQGSKIVDFATELGREHGERMKVE